MQYIDGKKFLLDYNNQKKALEELEELPEAHMGLNTQSEKVQSSTKGSTTENIALEIIERKREIERYFTLYNYAIEVLDAAEKAVIELFFTSNLSASEVIDFLSFQGIPKTTAYRIRNKALEKVENRLSERL